MHVGGRYVALLGVYGAWELRTNAETRFMWASSASYMVSVQIMARMIVHIFVQTYTLWGRATLLMQMTLHHVLALVCFGFALVYGRCHYYGCIAAAAESSTVFLSCLQAVMAFSTTKGPISGLLKAVSGILLWLTFLVFRMISLPLWM